MKVVKTLFYFLIFAFHLSLSAQDKLPKLGKIDKADLEMTDCSFDPDASAMLLIDGGEVNYNFTGGDVYLQTDIRQRIKILKENGISKADIKIDFYSKDRYEEISNLAGFVYNLDAKGNIVSTKLEKSAFYYKDINDKFSEIAIAFPDVKVGTVIEYSYRSYKKNNYDGLRNWMFQHKIPCRYSEYSIAIPQYFEFTYQAIHRQPLEYKAPTTRNPFHFYAMRNVPALKQEPFMNGYKDYIQRVDFQLSSINYPNGEKKSFRNTWEKLAEELLDDDDFGGEIKKNIPHTEDLQAKLKLMYDPLKKLQTVYAYVQKNMDWDENERIYSNDGIKKAWERKRGSTADINLLLLNLLTNAGVNAYPILVSTKQHGKLNTMYPYLGQFNEVMVYAEIAGKIFCLNAADKVNPYFLIPYEVQETQGFVVDKNNVGWKKLLDESQKYKQAVSIFANLDSNGKFIGEAYISNSGYARNIAINEFKKDESGKSLIYNNVEVNKIEVKNLQTDSLPFEQKAGFHSKLEKSGNYFFLPCNLFLSLAAQMPFTAEKRESDVDFNYLQSYSITGSFIIPNGFTFEELPKNMALVMPDTSIILKRIVQTTDENTVSFRITIDFNKASYPAEEYPDLKEYFNKLYSLLDEKLVVKVK